MHEHKPVIGFSCGDINGIGIELILKVVNDSRILDFCTPVIFGNNKTFNFYRKSIADINVNFAITKDLSKFNPKQVNLFSCWEEDVEVTPGVMNDTGGQYAILSLTQAAEALKAGKIDGLVTAPIHKKNIQTANFKYTGHTPYLKAVFGCNDVVMFMVAENMKIGLLSEHLPVKDLAGYLSKDKIISKVQLMHQSLQKDFGISKPKIAVLGFNPHAGDEGLIGKEEIELIKPAINDLKKKDMLCFGPFSADAFFARGQYENFDAVLALYHDQGLIPFKSLSLGEGVNYTAGMKAVRTSPDHGTAFDIAGKGMADETSMRQALFTCIDIINNRREYANQHSNPLRKMSRTVVANAVDEKINED
jgi:4-hydroxythreonine-4-phosphate dehydrogenase